MNVRKAVLIFLTYSVNYLVNALDAKYPLCAIEACQCTTRTISSAEVVDVTCTTMDDVDIFNVSLWSDSTKNQSYPYDKVALQDNKLTDLSKIIPSSNLTCLDLADNDISRIGDSVFQNLQNMKVLILSHNDLEIIHPDAFQGLPQETKLHTLKNLKELRLDHNKLHTLNQKIFEHTTEIEILDLSFNPIGTIDQNTLSAITALARLKELYLQYTDIKTLPDGMLHTPKYLQTLDLSGNPITTLPETLGQSQGLNNLYLNNTEFVNLTEETGFPKMPTLKVLHLCGNEFLTHLGKRSLSGLSNLEDLRICNNIVLSEIDALVIAFPISENGANVWPNINKLYLQNNKLSYLDSDIVARWDGLSELDINDNPWTCECENQWLIEDLMPIYLRINEPKAKSIMCAAPVEMAKFSFHQLYLRKSHMRCLDANGAHPENDAIMLVGILAGILITIPLTLFLILGYRRKWYHICGICDKSAASYSRRFYTASATDDFYRY